MHVIGRLRRRPGNNDHAAECLLTQAGRTAQAAACMPILRTCGQREAELKAAPICCSGCFFLLGNQRERGSEGALHTGDPNRYQDLVRLHFVQESGSWFILPVTVLIFFFIFLEMLAV